MKIEENTAIEADAPHKPRSRKKKRNRMGSPWLHSQKLNAEEEKRYDGAKSGQCICKFNDFNQI